MHKFRRSLSVERLEGRSLLAADFGIPEVKLYSGDEPAVVGNSLDIEDVQGLRGASVQIHFDQERLRVDSKAVRAGTAWDGKGMAIANINHIDGIINAFVFSIHELEDATGSLIEIDFQPSTPAPTAHSPNATAQAVRPPDLPNATAQAVRPPDLPNATASAVRPPDLPNAMAQAVRPSELPNSTAQAVRPPDLPNATAQAVRPPDSPNATAQAVRPTTAPSPSASPITPARPGRGFSPPPRAEGEAAAIELIAAAKIDAAESTRDFCVPATPQSPWGLPFPDDWQKKLRSRWGLD